MAYFVTGGTGFIGRFLIENLLKRGEPVYVLVRKESQKKLDALRAIWNADDKQVVAVFGDLGKPDLGVTDADKKRLKGKIKHMFDLAAVYDLNATAEDQQLANIDGTRRAVALAEAMEAGCFHHASSIAAAGLYEGTFREDMFEEAEELDHPYFRTKHLSEGIVRKECKRRGASTVRHSWSAIRKPAISIRSTGPTTSSSCYSGCAICFRLDADNRHRGRTHQHRSGRLRRQRDGLPRAQERASTESVSTLPIRSRTASVKY